jgi:hypothetical protein
MATATFFSLPHLFAPLQAFVHWLAGGPAPAPARVGVRVSYPSAPAAVQAAPPSRCASCGCSSRAPRAPSPAAW